MTETTRMGLNFKAYDCEDENEMYRKIGALHSEYRVKRDALQQKINGELQTKSPDEAVVNDYINQLAELEREYQQQRSDTLLEYKSVLSQDGFARALRELRIREADNWQPIRSF